MDSPTDTAAGTAPETLDDDLAEQILGLLRLERVEVDIFRGHALPGDSRRLFGGQVAAQALAAAGYTAEGTRPHSLHAYFLRPGDTGIPVVFQVERLHDGRTFRRRRVTAIQRGEAILCLESSFTADSTNATDYDPAPAVPGPEDCEDYESGQHRGRDGRVSPWRLLDARTVPAPDDAPPAPDGRLTIRDFWFRFRPAAVRAGEDIMPEAVITYLSDLTLSSSALRPSRSHPEGRTDVTALTSLDHSVWFHNPVDTRKLGDWLLFAKTAPATGPMRGLTAGQFFTRDGVLVASVAQECLAHSRDAAPAPAQS
jgi:acyl-CoA thioesterase-2